MNEDVRKEIDILKSKVEQLGKSQDDLRFMIRISSATSFRKIGNIKVSKKTIAGVIVSLLFSITNFLLRLFDYI